MADLLGVKVEQDVGRAGNRLGGLLGCSGRQRPCRAGDGRGDPTEHVEYGNRSAVLSLL